MMERMLAKLDALQEKMKAYNKKTEGILQEVKSLQDETVAY
jgi:hypothetical protein